MTGRRQLGAALAIASLLGHPAAARPRDARSAEARRHFDAGTRLYEQGRFADALVEFRAANEIKPDPMLIYDLAQTSRALGNDEDAYTFYRAYADAAPYAANRVETLGKIRALEEQLARRRTQAAEADAAWRVARTLKAQADEAVMVAGEAQQRADRLSRSVRPLHRQWWFWTVTGILVAGGVAAGVAFGRPSAPRTDQGNISF